MRTLRLSLAGLIILTLLGGMGTVVANAQEGETHAIEGLFTGSLHWVPTDECEATVWTVTDALGDTTFGTAVLHSEHCPQTDGPASTKGEMQLFFEDASTLTATYAVACEPVAPEGPALISCTPYAGEVTGGTGRFEGATGTLGFDRAFVFYDGVAWPMLDVRWASTIAGSLVLPEPAAAE